MSKLSLDLTSTNSFFLYMVAIIFTYTLILCGCTSDNPGFTTTPVNDMSYIPDLFMDDMIPQNCTISGRNTCSLADMSVLCRMADGKNGACICNAVNGCCCLN